MRLDVSERDCHIEPRLGLSSPLRYRSRRVPPLEPEPSPVLSTMLARARRICRARSRSLLSIRTSTGRISRTIRSITV